MRFEIGHDGGAITRGSNAAQAARPRGIGVRIPGYASNRILRTKTQPERRPRQVGSPPIGSFGPGRKVYACPDPSGTMPLRVALSLPQRHSPCSSLSHSHWRLFLLRHGRQFLSRPWIPRLPLRRLRLPKRALPPTSRRAPMQMGLQALPKKIAPQRRATRASPTPQPRR